MVDSKFFHIFLSLKFDKPLNQLLLYDKCFIRGPEKLQLVRLRIELYYLRERRVRGRRSCHGGVSTPFAEDVLLELSTLITYYINRAKKSLNFLSYLTLL